jgi:hypothetical protein
MAMAAGFIIGVIVSAGLLIVEVKLWKDGYLARIDNN